MDRLFGENGLTVHNTRMCVDQDNAVISLQFGF